MRVLEKPLEFYSTTRCNKRCKHCNALLYKHMYPGYEATMEDVGALCLALEREDAFARSILITGGEPLLWSCLTAAVKAFGQYDRIGKIVVYTNGKLLHRYSKRDLRFVHRIRMTITGDAAWAEYKVQKKRFGRRLTYVNHRRFIVSPNQIIGGSPYPVKCHCGYSLIFMGRVYACPYVLAAAHETRDEKYRIPSWATAKIEDRGCFDPVSDHRTLGLEACKICRGNGSLRFLKEDWSEG